jgi:hypothetical protein
MIQQKLKDLFLKCRDTHGVKKAVEVIEGKSTPWPYHLSSRISLGQEFTADQAARLIKFMGEDPSEYFKI